MTLSAILEAAVALAALASPFVALRIARTQAAHHSLVEAITSFDQAVNVWMKAADGFIHAADAAASFEAYCASVKAHSEVLRTYEVMSLLSSRRVRSWLERHWLKRQKRTQSAIAAAATGVPDPEAARLHIEDYELGWPTVRDVLRRAAGVRLR